jgi:hypothetical protein
MTGTIFDSGVSSNNGRSALIAQPLTVVLTAGEREIVGPGKSHVLGVTVSNQGGLDAIVHLTIEPISKLSWDVRGGTTTQVELLPSPGQVEEKGAINLPLNQQYGQQIIALQVKDLKGKPTARTITFEIFNPNPTDPSKAAAQAAATTQAVNASNTNLIKTLQQQSAKAAKAQTA